MLIVRFFKKIWAWLNEEIVFEISNETLCNNCKEEFLNKDGSCPKCNGYGA